MTKPTLALLMIAACGDNLAIAPDAPPPDAPQPAPHAVIVSGDFAAPPGLMSVLDLGAMTVSEHVSPNGSVDSDPMLRKFGDELFVINRSDNNVTIVDATTFAVKEQLATGAGSDPQDVAVVGDKLYVPGFTTAGVVVLTRGSVTTTTISLASLDPDGKPNCNSAFTVGTDVYVSCELLDAAFKPRGPGKVAVIDTITDTVRTTITLTTANPLGLFEQMPDSEGPALVIATAPGVGIGDYSTGCIEKITVGATPVAAGCLAKNVDLHGFANRIGFQTIGSLNVMWLVGASFDQTAPFAAHGNLQGYDLQTNCLWPAPITPTEQVLVDAVICPTGDIVVADTTMAANGLRVYNNNTIERTMAPLPIGLAPASTHGLVCY